MKFLPLIWKNIWRKKFRTTFTLLSLFIAFLLFGILMTIRAAFSFGIDLAGLDRLVLIHKISLIMPLPVSYRRAHPADTGRADGVASDLVRRHVPGTEKFLREHRRRTGDVHEDLPGIQAPARTVCRVAG